MKMQCMFLSQWSRSLIELRGGVISFLISTRDESSRFPCRHCCILLLAAPPAFFNELLSPDRAVQVFGLFRDFGDRPDGKRQNKSAIAREAGKLFSRLIFSPYLEPKGDPTANRTAAGTELGEYLSVVSA